MASRRLFLATYEFRDGENEYTTKTFLNAPSEAGALQAVEDHLSKMWGPKTYQEEDSYYRPDGCVCVKAGSVTDVTTMTPLLIMQMIGFI